MRNEIKGSRDDLFGFGIQTVATFAYPFGDYDDTTDRIVRELGFSGARTSDGGYNTKQDNRYLLKRRDASVSTSASTIKSWIDKATQDKLWLIINFHRIDNSGNSYTYSPEKLQEIVNYLVTKNVRVVTLREGVSLMTP